MGLRGLNERMGQDDGVDGGFDLAEELSAIRTSYQDGEWTLVGLIGMVLVVPSSSLDVGAEQVDGLLLSRDFLTSSSGSTKKLSG